MTLLPSWCEVGAVPDISRAASDPRQNIILSGPCGPEVAGVQMLLEAEGYPVSPLAEKVPEPGDVLIVALSATPELGWWRHLSRLEHLICTCRCRMIVLVPRGLSAMMLRQLDCEVMTGDVPVSVLRQALLAALRHPEERRDEYIPPLTPAMSDALASVVAGKRVRKKVEYSHRHVAMMRLKFRNTMQFRRFIAGSAGAPEGWR